MVRDGCPPAGRAHPSSAPPMPWRAAPVRLGSGYGDLLLHGRAWQAAPAARGDQKLVGAHGNACRLLLGWHLTRRQSLAEWYDRVHAYAWSSTSRPGVWRVVGLPQPAWRGAPQPEGRQVEGLLPMPRGLFRCRQILDEVVASQEAGTPDAWGQPRLRQCRPGRKRRTGFQSLYTRTGAALGAGLEDRVEHGLMERRSLGSGRGRDAGIASAKHSKLLRTPCGN